ncbi:hypothetical protein LAZ67_21001914 [Cordylochernes scorpioides]|uniref:Mos1 transposase HTH domain-containing protein n=1 Tax=Cordylochernes scorpioides TaxID=51811 RepID=A0ABY6LME6_9ARAC|nr:hypothetical protein LAZ67_21001914 [Cordylochernes scorpioides]
MEQEPKEGALLMHKLQTRLCNALGISDLETQVPLVTDYFLIMGLEKNAPETFQMLQKAFKDDCILRSQSWKWHKAFKEGREEDADEPRSGRPTTARTDENVDRVLEVLRTDRRLSIQQIADTLHIAITRHLYI